MLETSTNNPRSPQDSLSSSEDAVRHSKASLSVEAAFAAEGLGSPSSGIAALVADYVVRQTRDIPTGKMANMSPGSGNLGIAAAAGVNVVLGSLTADQRAVMRAGGNPLNPADMATIGAKLGLAAYTATQLANKGTGLGGNNSGRFTNMKEATAADQAAVNFAHQIGADPAYAKLFVGASAESLRAISEFIRNGKPANDNDLHTVKDAQAWIGAIRAGKIDPNDPNLPPSIKKIIQGMKDEGIDPATADPKAISGYFKKHPEALEAAKKQARADIGKQEGLTDEQKLQKQADAKTPPVVKTVEEGKKPETKVAAKPVKKIEGTLGL